MIPTRFKRAAGGRGKGIGSARGRATIQRAASTFALSNTARLVLMASLLFADRRGRGDRGGRGGRGR